MGGGDDEEASVNIRISNGPTFCIRVKLSSSVEDLKSVVAENCEIPAEQQRLIYKGRVMKGVQTLKSFGVEDNETVHLVRGFASAAVPLDRIHASIRSDPIVENVMSNPEILRNLYMNDSEVREILDRTPALLRRIFSENVNLQEPFLNENENTTTSSAAPNTSPLPNPWPSAGNEIIAGIGNMGLDMLNSASTPQGCISIYLMIFILLHAVLMLRASFHALLPEERYATELSQLREMGFFDAQENIRALIATAGNVQAAVERLLGNPGQ